MQQFSQLRLLLHGPRLMLQQLRVLLQKLGQLQLSWHKHG
jgi:hypothetical protein